MVSAKKKIEDALAKTYLRSAYSLDYDEIRGQWILNGIAIGKDATESLLYVSRLGSNLPEDSEDHGELGCI